MRYLTGQWVHTNASTHLLEVASKLWVLFYIILVFRSKLFKG